MGSVPPLSFLLMIVSGWVHRHQLIVIEFLQAENRLLKERLRGKRIRFTDAERALLARKAKAVGRKALLQLDTLVSPDTLMRWHRRLVARNGISRSGAVLVVRDHAEISELIVRMAQDNPGWGYTRIQGALVNLGHSVGRGTVANVLKRNGIEPAPERSKRTRWSTFLKAHWKIFAASDFFTVEVWTSRGLVTHYLLFVISLVDRAVHIAGITTRPDEAWMLQAARNLIDAESAAMRAKRYLIIDRDTKYSVRFRRLLGESGTKSFDCRPITKSECLRGALCSLDQGRMPEADDLHRAGIVASCGGEYHCPLPQERNHQGLDNRLIRAAPSAAQGVGQVHRKQRLGGMLSFYCRQPIRLASTD